MESVLLTWCTLCDQGNGKSSGVRPPPPFDAIPEKQMEMTALVEHFRGSCSPPRLARVFTNASHASVSLPPLPERDTLRREELGPFDVLPV